MWKIYYFNDHVKSQIEKWPIGIYADYLRLILLIEQYGADLRLPHSRAMGKGLFELRCKGNEGIGRVFYGLMIGKKYTSFIPLLKKHKKRLKKNLKWHKNA
jgi:phage-related protein